MVIITFAWSAPRGVAGYTEAHTLRVGFTPTGALGSYPQITECHSVLLEIVVRHMTDDLVGPMTGESNNGNQPQIQCNHEEVELKRWNYFKERMISEG
jgi:hypothetical protein